MAPRAKKNVLIMLTNVGATSLEQSSLDEEPFIDKVKYAMKILVEKKIFLQPKDEIGIITMGDETDNPNEIDHVKLYCEHLLVPNWEIIKYINGLEATKYPNNWIEGLHVALCYIEKEVVDPNYNIFLVIFNNFKEGANAINEYDSDVIVNQLKECNVHLLFIGEKSFDDLTSNPNPSEKFVLSILNNTEAQYEKLNTFIEHRKFYIPPPTNPIPWKFDLELAGLSIPCAEYLKTTETTNTISWKLSYKQSEDVLENSADFDTIKNNARVIKKTVAIDQHRDNVPEDNIICGYQFGRQYIPFSEEDENAVRYVGSQKGMMIYGFVPQDEVKIEYWSGEGSRIVVPASEEESTAFYSLVQAMVEVKHAAIVRKVYADNSLPKMGVLFPKVDDDEIWCLVHIEIPFAEDVRYFNKVPITSIEKQVSKEKLDALDEFIDSMTISDNNADDLDYLNPGMFPNVQSQYHYNAIGDRALNPNAPLLPVNDYIKKCIETPEFLKIRAKPCIEKLEKAFEDCKSIPEIKIKKDVLQNIMEKDRNIEKPAVQQAASVISKDSPDEGIFSGSSSSFKMEEFDF